MNRPIYESNNNILLILFINFHSFSFKNIILGVNCNTYRYFLAIFKKVLEIGIYISVNIIVSI